MKRLLALCMLAIFIPALASSPSVTLRADLAVADQVRVFSEYLAALPAEQRAEWFEQIDIIASDRRTVFSLMAQQPDADVVFVSSGGARYHGSNMCQGLKFTETLSAITKVAAVEMKRTPCKFCYPNGDRL